MEGGNVFVRVVGLGRGGGGGISEWSRVGDFEYINGEHLCWPWLRTTMQAAGR